MISSASCSALSSATRLGNVKRLCPKVRQDAPRRAQLAVRAYTVTLKFPDEEDKVVEVNGISLDSVKGTTAPTFVAIVAKGLAFRLPASPADPRDVSELRGFIVDDFALLKSCTP